MTISQNPKKKEKEKTLGINLKYNKYLFSLKIHFPKKIVDFFFFKDKKNYEWIFVIWKFEAKRLRNLATKKLKIKAVAHTVINPKVIEIFEDWILKGWQFAFCIMQERLH